MYNAGSDFMQTPFPTRYDVRSKKKSVGKESALWDKENIGLDKEVAKSSKARRTRRGEVLERLNDYGTPKRDRDPDDFFKPSSPSKIYIKPGKSYVENLFKDVEDLEANFKLSSRTPRRGYSGTNTSLLDTPKCSFLPSPGEPSLTSSLVKSARRQAMIEGHNDFKEILKKANINASDYYSAFFSSGKKGRRSGAQFKCSTPVVSPTRHSSTPSKTPDLSANRIKTPAPLSGVHRLISTPSESSQLGTSAITPTIKDIIKRSADHQCLLPSPEKVPPEVKSNILSGVVCYVEVRSGKENRSEAVSTELKTLGAKIEKYFTKKVTHVLFNEGRVSTYLRAKKDGIPLVSVLWIEACKIALAPVDPLLYRPIQMDKYDDILPFQTLKKRRMRRVLKTAEKIMEAGIKRNKSLITAKVSSPPKITFERNAITERKSNSRDERTEKHCTKKLEFNDPQPRVETSIIEIVDDSLEEEGGSKSKEEGSGKRRRVEDIREYIQVSEVKKRKLFNPEDTFLSGALQIEEDNKGEDKGVGAGSTVSSKKVVSSLLKRTRKKLLGERKSGRKEEEERGKSKAKRGLLSQLMSKDPPLETSSSSDFFEPKKSITRRKPKPPPSIVFTKLTKSQRDKYEKVVKKLGLFTIADNVTNATTHVVTDKPTRTVKLLKGIVRGCWILSTDWLEASGKAGKWLCEENYEFSDFSPAVVYCRRERKAFGPVHCLRLFKECGEMYISKTCKMGWRDLAEIAKACCGKVVMEPTSAKILIGPSSTPPNPDIVRLSEKWILDSITQNQLLPYDKYLIA